MKENVSGCFFSEHSVETHDVDKMNHGGDISSWIFKDGGGSHLEFVRTRNSAIQSVDPENPTLVPNIWSG